MQEIIAQVIGFVGTGILFLSYQMPKKKQIVFCQILSISIFTAHYLLLGVWTGAMMNAIALVKTVLYYFDDRVWFGKTQRILFTILFSAVILAAGIWTWQDWTSVLPLLAMLINTLAYNIRKEKWFRLCMFPTSPLWLVYNLLNHSIPGLIGEILTTISIISAIIRYDILHQEPKKGNLFGFKKKEQEESKEEEIHE